MWNLERDFHQRGITCIAGVDEAGRGCLSGPVVAAAYIADADALHPGVRDSKQLSERRREELYAAIVNCARAYAVGLASSREVDEFNILEATRLAMTRALRSLAVRPDLVLIDGMELNFPQCPTRKIIRGDATVGSIAAASIIAKVTRDAVMRSLHRHYPQYGWAKNKGYGTAEHLDVLRRCGTSPLHRVTFGGVRQPKLVL